MIHSNTKVDNRLLKLYKVRRAERSNIKIDFDSLVDSNQEPNQDSNRNPIQVPKRDKNRDANKEANNRLVDDTDRDNNWFYEDPLAESSAAITVVAPESELITRKQTEQESCNNID